MNTFQLAQDLTKDPFTKGSFSGVYGNWNIIRYSFKVLSRLSVDNIVYTFLYHRCSTRSMSSIVNSFVNDKLHNDQLVYDFVRRKYRQVYPSLKQDIDFVVKQICRSLYRE